MKIGQDEILASMDEESFYLTVLSSFIFLDIIHLGIRRFHQRP